MSQQPSLWDVTPVPPRRLPPFQRRSPTSRAGAETAAPHAETQMARVYAHLAKCGSCGSTDRETQRALQLEINVVTARRNRLVKDGFVLDSGQVRNGGAIWTVVGL